MSRGKPQGEPTPPVICMCGHGSGDHGGDGCLICEDCTYFTKRDD